MKTSTKAVNMTMGWREMLVEWMRMEWSERSSGVTLAVRGSMAPWQGSTWWDVQEEQRSADWGVQTRRSLDFSDMLMQNHSLGVRRVSLHPLKEMSFGCLLLALVGAHDTWCISRGQVSDLSWPFVWSTKWFPRFYHQHPPHSSEHISVWGAKRHFRLGACCSSLSLSLCFCFSLGMSRRRRGTLAGRGFIKMSCVV